MRSRLAAGIQARLLVVGANLAQAPPDWPKADGLGAGWRSAACLRLWGAEVRLWVCGLWGEVLVSRGVAQGVGGGERGCGGCG